MVRVRNLLIACKEIPMADRRKNSTLSVPRGQFQRIERRVRMLDRRKHHHLHRFIYIDVRNIWSLATSKW